MNNTACDPYADFIESKRHSDGGSGIEPTGLPVAMFPFQVALTEWALRQGRAAVFADCGLGKTLVQLAWGDNVVRHTNRPVLLLTPLAVGHQTIAEAEKFGIDAVRSGDGQVPRTSIVVTNYERLHHFNRDDFAGVICDESSILKNMEGETRKAVTDFMRKMEFRLLCTATAAPNDYIELGTSSEALGHLGYVDMLTRFFKSDTDSIRPFVFGLNGKFNSGSRWRFKGHAELPFWRFVCSWARALRKPSDMGFDDTGFVLPPLEQQEHVIKLATPPDGELFARPAIGLAEQRVERRRTIRERCAMTAALVADTGQPALVWCHLNTEGDLLEQMIGSDCVQISGKDTDDAKEDAFMAFTRGEVRVLVTKPAIGAWGLNFQHCAHVTFFPSHSYEQTYQGIRRCWRFGQKRAVHVDMVTSEGEVGVLANLQRKSDQADKMFAALVAEMNRGQAVNGRKAFTTKTEVPSWL